MGKKVAGFIQCQETQVMTISRKKQELKDPKFIFFDTELEETEKLKFRVGYNHIKSEWIQNILTM
jgi:hypothetical protein